MRQIVIFLSLLIFVLQSKFIAYAQVHSGSSAELKLDLSNKESDMRVDTLREFLAKYNSPLASLATVLVENADKYNLDWRLVAAISGLESSFGREIPSNSFNGWGWGIYGNNVIRFSSWEEGIQTVSQGLRERYIDKGATDIYSIGRIYAASPTWASRITYLMEKITQFQLQNPKSLPISL